MHLVGHSLGGLVALESLRQAPELAGVAGGLPGLAAARQRDRAQPGAARGWGRPLLGRSARDCCRRAGVLGRHRRGRRGRRATSPRGLGRLFARFDGGSDGTVGLEETRLPGLADHCTVHSSHTGLVFSPDAVRQAAHFLRHGRFEHA